MRGDRCRGRIEGAVDLKRCGSPIARVGFEEIDGAFQQVVDELTIGTRIERQRLFGFGERLPAKGVAPDEGQGIAQHQAKRGRRLDLADRPYNDRMIGPNLAVMAGERGLSPIAPTGVGCRYGRRLRCFFRSRNQTVNFAEGVAWNARAFQHGCERPVRHERACRLKTSLHVAAAAREHASGDRMSGDHVEGAAVLVGDRIGVERLASHDVARDERIFACASWPGSRGHAEQSDPGAWRGGEMACWTPNGTGAGITAVGKAKFLQREFECLWRRAAERLGPQRSRGIAEQQPASLHGGFRFLGETFEDRNQHGANVHPVGAAGMGLIKRAPPLIELEKRGTGLQALGPRWRKIIKTLAAAGSVAEKPAHTILAEPVQQHIGERRAGLALT